MIADDAFALVDGPVGAVLGPALARAATMIGETRHLTVSPEGLAEWFAVFRVIQAAEIWANLPRKSGMGGTPQNTPPRLMIR